MHETEYTFPNGEMTNIFFSPADVLMCPPPKKDLYECDGYYNDRF